MGMFCYQCEQTAGGKGCTVQGACGKDPKTAAVQDVLIHLLKGISVYASKARELGVIDAQADRFVIEGLFTTITNVNFDAQRIAQIIKKAETLRADIQKQFFSAYEKKHGKAFAETLPAVIDFKPARSLDELVAQGAAVGIMSDPGLNEDIRSLRELLLYGLKGMAAYTDHALVLGKEDEAVTAFFHTALAALVDDSLSADQLTALNMQFGQVNLQCLALLDGAHTEHFGTPAPTKVSLGAKKGPAILVSGHDLLDLELLLKQTEGTGINIYTHSEMLPAHGYPKLNKYKHLAGHYGTAWQNQQKEFDAFPGAILMTTNCIINPKDTYKKNIFTTGLVAWPGVQHIDGADGKKDFSVVIAQAKQLGGFSADTAGKEILVGFGHDAVLGVADKVIDAVKKGAIKRFYLIGGCDGAKPGRNYYTEFAEKVPDDCVILTLACGKFRFNTLEFGDIGGIPRLLDCGQCNDAYSAIKIASALADAFKCSVNELPLSMILSWFEQKAVCILLTLLSLGIKNIKLGPSLPAFVSPNVLKILVEKFNIAPVKTPDEDLQETLAVAS